jgi:LAO/AO transport system kinase
MNNDWRNLIDEMQEGSERAMARLISRVENREPGWLDAMKIVHNKSGKAQVVGITGAPGAGKSTLTDKLTRELVNHGHTIGVIAVDPSSPFTGGALLGDRLRMTEICSLEGVFVRSMATRGALGGLSLAARDVVKIMDAAGKDIILIETVGVGQDEIDVVKTADNVMVVCVPGMGDGIQAIKAGIMEIASIFVVNKADREGADRTVAEINMMLTMCSDPSDKKIPILKTVASTGEGVTELIDALVEDLESKEEKKDWQEERAREEILTLLEKEVARYVRGRWDEEKGMDNAVRQVITRERDPYSIVEEMVKFLVMDGQQKS